MRLSAITPVFARHAPPDALKVFSATRAKEREALGERGTDWIRAHPEHEVFDKRVLQSSEAEFHCLTIVLAYWYVGSA